MAANGATGRRPIVLAPGEGRRYEMGRLEAVFKADGDETADAYSISEWWLDPRTAGPGAHAHPEESVFVVLEGTMSVLVDDTWIDAPRGSFVLIPGDVTHDFENRSDERAGMLSFSIPGPFEPRMAAIAEWFVSRAPSDAETRHRT
jgi:quercetin dioxygenase-like cupin family protein